MQKTNIGWTDFSAALLKYLAPNGQVVWACIKASAGCKNCYAESLKRRWWSKVLAALLGVFGWKYSATNMKRLKPFFDIKEAQKIIRSKELAGKRVFIDDMTDWAGPWVSDEIIDWHLAVFCLRSDVTFQTLTKHPERLCKYFSDPYYMNRVRDKVYALDQRRAIREAAASWPLPNLHIGVSTEDQYTFDWRTILLMQIPAAVRWVSMEPLLGAIDPYWVWPLCVSSREEHEKEHAGGMFCDERSLDWGVLGGESGAGFREMPLDDGLRVVEEFQKAGVPIYVKQDSGPRPGKQGRIPDKYWVHQFPKAA